MKKFDVLIIGGGVAGMTAAIYAKRRGRSVCIIEKFALGGQVLSIEKIENFPSQKLIDGISLCNMFAGQVKALGVEVVFDDILTCELSGKEKVVVGKKEKYLSSSVIIATGLSYVGLGINENDYLGKGVSFCAVCDANFYRNKPVLVASKNGSALADAKLLSGVCSKVTVLDSSDVSVLAKVVENPKIKFVSNVQIKNIFGKDNFDGVEMVCDGEAKKIKAAALFVCLGKKPINIFDEIKTDKNGFILTDENMQTSVPGVFAVGDVRAKTLKQIVTACADGAIAGQNA